MKIRSFLAFDITPHMREELGSIIALLSKKVDNVRWIDPKLMHCTIKFFGDVEEELLLGRVSDVVAREVLHQAPISLVGQGVGVFPNWRYPRILWAGLSGDSDAVMSLHKRLEEAFEEFGFVKDQRLFRLHLTLARTKSKFKSSEGFMTLVEKLTEKEFGRMTVSSLTLYKSVLTPSGPVYTVLKKFPFGGKK